MLFMYIYISVIIETVSNINVFLYKYEEKKGKGVAEIKTNAQVFIHTTLQTQQIVKSTKIVLPIQLVHNQKRKIRTADFLIQIIFNQQLENVF